jgi:DNA adenine methylase
MLFDLLHNYGEEIKTVAAMATVLGVFVAALSIWISTQRARKELAVKLINDWASEYTLEMKQAFDLAEELDHSKIAEISDGKSEAVEIIGAGNVSAIQRILKVQAPSFSVPPKHGASDNILLSRVQCKIIDYQWTSYIEPFLGGGAIMRHKLPATVNIGVDRDPEAVKAVARAHIAGSGEAGPAVGGIAGNGEEGFRFEAGDALAFLRSYRFAGDELVYCDPPYLFETRSSRRTRYAFELGNAGEHHALLDIITALPCMVMISGYWSRLYANRLRGWHSVTFQAMTHGGPRTEWLWSNFAEPVALHDYRHLGAGFRERERIKRKKQRWTARLHRLPMLERQALLAAIDEAWRIPSSKMAMHDRQRIPSPKTTMPPVASPFSTMPRPVSPELARAESSIATNSEGGRHRQL